MPIFRGSEVDVSSEIEKHKILIVGSGFFGLTLAERISSQFNLNVLVLEKREHIGGNAYSFTDPDTGIEIHKYGTHIFHTKNKAIWDYINQFSSFNDYRHIVESNVDGINFPIPINLRTLEMSFGKSFSESEAENFFALQKIRFKGQEITNAKMKAVSLVGEALYEKFYEGYTKKQWGVDPLDLPPDIISRIPVRTNLNAEYFDDEYQGIPSHGYGNLFSNMVAGEKITVLTGVDFFDFSSRIRSSQALIYSGAIDRLFQFRHGALGWRSVSFEIEKIEKEKFQNRAVVNYPEISVPYTRIHEFKHLHPEVGKIQPHTIIAREYSQITTNSEEPYYPINTQHDREILSVYTEAARLQKNIIVGGRLGRYQYLDMHMAIGNALSVFANEIPDLLKRLDIYF